MLKKFRLKSEPSILFDAIRYFGETEQADAIGKMLREELNGFDCLAQAPLSLLTKNYGTRLVPLGCWVTIRVAKASPAGEQVFAIMPDDEFRKLYFPAEGKQ